jgi:hypothetical protein
VNQCEGGVGSLEGRKTSSLDFSRCAVDHSTRISNIKPEQVIDMIRKSEFIALFVVLIKEPHTPILRYSQLVIRQKVRQINPHTTYHSIQALKLDSSACYERTSHKKRVLENTQRLG